MGEAMVLSRDGFVRMPNSLLEALSRMELSGREFRTVMAVYRFTAGFGKELSRISLKFLSSATGIAPSNLVRLINGLVEKGLLIKKKIKNRLHLGLNLKLKAESSEEVRCETGKKCELNRSGSSSADLEQKKPGKIEQETRFSSEKAGQNLNEKRNEPSTCSESEKVRKLPSSGQFQKNESCRGKTGSHVRELKTEHRREIIEAWERVFGRGPEIWTGEQIIAADYMLYLLDTGGINQVISNPVAYLNKIAEKIKAGLIEDFENYRIRKEKSLKARQAYERRIRAEQRKAAVELPKKLEAEKKAEEVWKELDEKQQEFLFSLIAQKVHSKKKHYLKNAAIKYISQFILEGLLDEFKKSLEEIGKRFEEQKAVSINT